MTSVPQEDDESDEESEDEETSSEDEPDGLAEFMSAFKEAPSSKDAKHILTIRPDYDNVADLLKEAEKLKVVPFHNQLGSAPKGSEWDITTLDTEKAG